MERQLEAEREAAPAPRQASPAAAPRQVHPLLRLQRAIGNQAVQHLIQTKLAVSQPGDASGQKADRVAEQLTRLPGPRLQRKCACGTHAMAGGECEECSKKNRLGLQTKLAVNEPVDAYEQEADCIADRVMANPIASRTESAPHISRLSGRSIRQGDATSEGVRQALVSSGTPLEPAVRADMEERFGQDFSGVRVHTDSSAAESARALRARAYTVGGDIVFDRGHYAPGTSAGKRLLAHELTHVVQQSGGNASTSPTTLQRDATDDLANLMAHDLDAYVRTHPEPYAHILEVFRKTSSDIEDNVAAAFTKLQTSATLEKFAETEQGRAVLDVLTEAMITGSVTLFESEQAERILIAKRTRISVGQYVAQAVRIAELRHKAAPAFSEDQRVSQIAKDLSVYVANNLYDLVINAFEDIPSKIEDNVAGALVETLPDARLEQIAGDQKDPKGRAMLDVLYEAMITGSVSSFESLQCERILLAKAKVKSVSTEQYVTEAERIAELRNKAEDSLLELATDMAAIEVAHELNEDVANRRYGEVIKKIRDLSSDVEDNVASHFIELQTPARLEEFAADKEGRAMLHVLYAAIITGKVSAFERLQAGRILAAQARTSVPTSADLAKAIQDPPIFPLNTAWSSTATIVAELLPDGKVKVFYDSYSGLKNSEFDRERQSLLRHYGLNKILHGIILDPDEIVLVKLYKQGGVIVPVPAIQLIDFFNQQKEDTLGKIKTVSALAATVGLGGVGASGILGWADTIAFAISAGSLFVNAYRDEIAKTEAGRQFLEAWDIAEGIAGYYNWGRLGVDGLRLVHAKVSPALERWRQEASTNLSSAERGTIAKAQQHTEAWLDAVKKAESAEAAKYLEAHPPKKVEGKPGNQHADIEGGHQVREVSGGLGCEFHSPIGTPVPCPREFARTEPAKTGEPAKPAGSHDTPAGPGGAPHGAPPSGAPSLSLDDLRQQAAPLRAERDRLASRLNDTEHRVQSLRENIDEATERGLTKRAEAFEKELEKLRPKAADQLRELERAQGKLAEIESEIQRLSPPDPSRPTWRQSEMDVGRDLGYKFEEQVSYLNRERVPAGTEGSVRPDWVAKDGSVSVEVKNYNIGESVDAVVENVSSQAIYRTEHLPLGMKQKVVIDIRGQVVALEQRNAVVQGIVRKSKGAIKPEDITFKE